MAMAPDGVGGLEKGVVRGRRRGSCGIGDLGAASELRGSDEGAGGMEGAVGGGRVGTAAEWYSFLGYWCR